MMLKLGIIGTGWISGSFVEAAHLTKKYSLEAVYSRNLESAVSFTEDFDDIEDFLLENYPDMYEAKEEPETIMVRKVYAVV